MLDSVPDDFLWGAAIHGHAVNGESIDDDWSRWEQRPGTIAHADHLGKAADHWNRFRDDFRVARDFGLNAMLITLEWSRIQPRPDEFDDKALKHYGKILDALHEAGITPIIALHHVALPGWFSEARGWKRSTAPERFADYTRRVIDALGNRCDHWIPILEPMHYSLRAYRMGHWPPAHRNARRAHRVEVNLVRAHHSAFDIIKEQHPDALVGLGLRVAQYRPRCPYRAWDARAAARESKRNNRRFIEALNSYHERSLFDFVGLTHFGSYEVYWRWRSLRRVFVRYTQSDLRTPIAYQDRIGFKKLVNEFAAFGRPLYIAGNGIKGSDPEQCAHLLDTVSAVQELLRDGIELHGYIHYALLDGFEWEQGYTAKYGLFHVDPERLTRTPKPAALILRELLETGRVRPATLKQFCPDRVETSS